MIQGFGYGRVSTDDQNPDLQWEALKRAGLLPSHIFFDVESGTRINRPEYQKLIRKIKEGLVKKIIVNRIDRLGFLDHEMIGALREYLDWREQRAIDEALWVHSNGCRVSRNYVYNMVVRYASLLGLHDPDGPLCRRFGPHCCRHFFTTMMRRNGMPREFIQELRGDRRKEAIDIYDHMEVEELKRSYLKFVPKLLEKSICASI